MKKLLFVFCCLLGLGLSAQVLTVSEEIVLRSDTEYHLVGKLGGQTLMFQDRGTKHFLTAFGRQMNESWEKELELKGRNVRLLEIATRHDNTAFSLVYLYRQSGRNYLRLDRLNPAGNLQDSVTLVDFGAFISNPIEEVFLSDDGSKLLLLVTETQQKIRYIGVDLEKMTLLYDNLLEPEKFFFNENFLQADISNAGDMYFFVERDNFRSKRKVHKYDVHQYLAGQQKQNSFEISLGDSLTYDVVFAYDNLNDRITGGGLYSTKDFIRADGYFHVLVDPRNTLQARALFHSFPLNLVKNIEGKKFNKKRPGLDEISVREAMLRRDGGLLLITERNRQLERRSAAAQTQVFNNYANRPLVDHHYNEIVVFAMNPDGSAHWSNILHKKQYSQDDGGVYSSFLLMESPRSLRFLFNDEIRFENTVSEYVVNGRGEFDRNSLFNTRDLNLRIRFRDGLQVAGNEVILPSEHRNRLRLVKMTYELGR